MARTLQIYQLIAHRLGRLDLDQPSHVAQCRYAVAVTSRAAAVRALNAIGLNAIGLNVSDGFMRDYGYTPQDPSAQTQVIADQPGEVFYVELDHHTEWRPVPEGAS